MPEMRGEGVFKRYKFFKGHRILSGCLFCQGALLGGYRILAPDGMAVYKCFHCGRMYLGENNHIRLWPYREYEHLYWKKKEEASPSTGEQNTSPVIPIQRKNLRS
jgi:hypothetical protein